MRPPIRGHLDGTPGLSVAVGANVPRNARLRLLQARDLLFTLANPAATGEGGTCFGDSGGPHFLALEGEGSNLVVALQSGGDMNCQALNTSQRIDHPAVLAFLAPYVGP